MMMPLEQHLGLENYNSPDIVISWLPDQVSTRSTENILVWVGTCDTRCGEAS